MLSGKQKRFLRALAVNEKAVITIGKEGLSYNLVDSCIKALNARELVKVSVLKSNEDDIKELSFDLAMHTKSELVQIIGKCFILYKPSSKRLIDLP